MNSPVIEVGPLAKVRAQERTVVRAADLEILVLAVGDDVFAVGLRCTHRPISLLQGHIDAVDCTIMCPIHVSRFRLRTGDVLDPPADVPLPTYPVEIVDDIVYVRTPSLPASAAEDDPHPKDPT